MTIKTWRELSPALLEFAKLSCSVRKADAALDDRIQKLRAVHAKNVETKRARLAELYRSIQAFCKSNKARFDPTGSGCRSCRFSGGSFGFRLDPPSVHIPKKKIEEVTEWLANKFDEVYVRTTVEPNREALRQALVDGDARFKKLMKNNAITLKQPDKFFLDTETEG